MRAVFDSVILIDHLRGVRAASREISASREPVISIITWMEVLAGAQDRNEEAECHALLDVFQIRGVEMAIARRAVAIRQHKNLRLPDAIIWATAQELGCLLVTRNTKDFPANSPGIRIPYRV